MNEIENYFQNLPIVQKIGNNRVKIILAALALLSIYIFYLTRNLFFVNTLNDFNLYFNRAQEGMNDTWVWAGASDRLLLSLIEYIPLKLFTNDFLLIYKTIIALIATLLVSACALFVFVKNDLLPNFYVKLLSVAFLLSMPYFMIASITVEQSMLFATMLLFFLVSYRNKYLGVVGYLVILARPEGIIVVALYIAMLIFDKSYRKNIFINFLTFIVIFVGMRYWEHKVLFANTAVNAIPELNNLKQIDAGNIFSVLGRIYMLPVNIILYALEILQNWFAFILFLVGIVVSYKNKSTYIFYMVMIAYVGMGMVFFAKTSGSQMPYINFLLSKVAFLNDHIEISNGFNPQMYAVESNSRYRLILYPSVAVFVVAGIVFIYQMLVRFTQNYFLTKETVKQTVTKPVEKSKSKTSQKSETKTTVIQKFNPTKFFTVIALPIIIFVFLIANNVNAYDNSTVTYGYEYQIRNLHPMYKAAILLRKNVKWNDMIMIDDLCEGSSAQFPALFLVYSGCHNMFIRICPNSGSTYFCHDHPQKTTSIADAEIYKLNPQGFVYLKHNAIFYKENFEGNASEQINNIFKYDDAAMTSLKVKYIITSKQLSADKFEKLNEVDNLKIYKYLKSDKN